jgi:hypothetical protein
MEALLRDTPERVWLQEIDNVCAILEKTANANAKAHKLP